MSTAAPTPADLGHHPPYSTRTILLFAAIALFAAMAWCGVVFQLMIFVPRSAKLFADFRMRLPYLTELVLQQGWLLAAIAALVAFGCCLAIRRNWAWSFLLLLLPMMLNVFILVSLYLPTMYLVIGLQDQLAAGR